MNAGATALLAAAGLPVGAFLNVVIERVPDRLPLRGTAADAAEGAAAEAAGSAEGDVPVPGSWLGVPVLPWVLHGGGRASRLALPRRRLVVELATVVVFAVLAARYGDEWAVVPLLGLGASLVAVTFVDLEHLRIPDRITFPTLALLVPAIVVVSAVEDVNASLRGAAIGSVAYFVLLLLPHLAYPRGMGFGDVKLALVMGLVLGWVGWHPLAPVAGPMRLVLYALVLGCLLGVVFGLVHAAVTRRRGEFPFGPALAVGCLVVVLYAPQLRI
jgi:leader peptidase (prepilin peptidase)/N-methyltransferase